MMHLSGFYRDLKKNSSEPFTSHHVHFTVLRIYFFIFSWVELHINQLHHEVITLKPESKIYQILYPIQICSKAIK